MDDRTLGTLEFQSLVELLLRHVQTPQGRGLVERVRPSVVPDQIKYELALTTECVHYSAVGGVFGLSGIEDTGPSISELQISGSSLDPQQILRLEHLVAVGVDLRGQLRPPEGPASFPNLYKITARLPDLRNLLASIAGKILPNGEIDDNASPGLARIRKQITISRSRIYTALESLMRGNSGSVQDEIVTVRNGRFVIPLRSDSRGKVPGVMHGVSSSGMTSYVEPLGVIEQNNDMVRLREQEEVEIGEILLAISDALRAHASEIKDIEAAIARIDLVQARARLSREFNCVEPVIVNRRVLRLQDARHPLLENSLRQTGGAPVPISLHMDEDHQVLVISGPNAGGKTVVLKTVGLVGLMAQSGLHVPAAAAELPVFGQIFADIGDQQSIAANLSTFTAHIRNVSDMAEVVRPPALILLDEVGTGTDPDEGASLAVAIVSYFKRSGATTLASTHYNRLKIWASENEDVLNASVEFDESTLSPTYRLITGVAGASAGLEIARRMSLPAEIIEQARTLLDPDLASASQYLKRLKSLVDEQEANRAALEDERQATAEKYARLDLDFAHRESERQGLFEAELSRVISEFTAESQQMIKQIGDRVTAARLKKEADARLAELRRSGGVKLRKAALASPATSSGAASRETFIVDEPTALIADAAVIEERDTVRVRPLDKEGVVESISDETYVVVVGSLRYRARREELERVRAAETPTTPRHTRLPKGVTADLGIDENFNSEVNVIGQTSDEAIDRIDKFLDEAFLAGADTVRIVHGHGKGTLRRAVRELLSGHPHIETFQEAPANQGGAGATIANLKK
jgi:DNA mismatch repair protein MutS2